MKQEELNKVLELHKKWLNGEEGGVSADLRSADLYGADLEGVNLKYADLYGADLSYANLKGANLRGTYLEGVNLEYAENIYIFNAYDTSKRIVYCVRHKDTFMCKTCCFWGTLDELEAKVKATHNSKVYLANIEIMRELLGE